MSYPAYWINAEKREITEVEFTTSEDIRRYVCHQPQDEGFELGGRFGPFGDSVLYVDGGGLYSRSPYFFRDIRGPGGQPFRSNGLVVGPEINPLGNDANPHAPPDLTLEDLRSQIQFLSWEDILTWLSVHGNDPAVSINGKVLQTWFQFWGELPMPEAPHGR